MVEDDDETPEGWAGPRGQYANHYRVGHNENEFVIDFGQYYEGDREERFHTRIVTSPQYARELRDILSEAIYAYEQTYGIGRHDH